MLELIVELIPEGLVLGQFLIDLGQFFYCINQGFSDKNTAIGTKMPAGIGAIKTLVFSHCFRHF